MQEKDLEKFIVFVESMRTGDNDAEVDIILEGLFNIYGNKNQFTFSDEKSALDTAIKNPQQLNRVWPKLYAKKPDILLTALRHPDKEKSMSAYNFIRKFMQTNPSNKNTLGSLMEKGVQTAMKDAKLRSEMETFLTKRRQEPDRPNRMSRTQDKAFEREWAAGRDDKAEEILQRAGM